MRMRARDTPNTRRVGEYETCKKQIRADHSCRRIRVLHYRNKNKIQSFQRCYACLTKASKCVPQRLSSWHASSLTVGMKSNKKHERRMPKILNYGNYCPLWSPIYSVFIRVAFAHITFSLFLFCTTLLYFKHQIQHLGVMYYNACFVCITSPFSTSFLIKQRNLTDNI